METSGRSCQLIVAAIKFLISLQCRCELIGSNRQTQIIFIIAIGSLSVPSGSTYPFSHDPAAATVWESDRSWPRSWSTVDGQDGSDSRTCGASSE